MRALRAKKANPRRMSAEISFEMTVTPKASTRKPTASALGSIIAVEKPRMDITVKVRTDSFFITLLL